MSYFDNILDTFIPHQCVLCKTIAPNSLCSTCLDTLPNHIIISPQQNPHPSYFFRYNSQLISEVRPHKYPHLKTVISLTPFQDPHIRHTIHRFKYQNIQNLSYPLSRILLKGLSHFIQSQTTPFVICPIPLHPKRQAFRGYNQSLLLASHLSKDLTVPLYTDLIRTKYTQPQMSLSHKEDRQQNLVNAFWTPNTPSDYPHTILLIDDVTTTLSTLSEAAKALYKGGFCDIYAITIAR